MARSKIDFKPYAAFLFPNASGHRNEVKFAIGIGLAISLYGVGKYYQAKNKPLSQFDYNNQLFHSQFKASNLG
jgi:hypothetical protein